MKKRILIACTMQTDSIRLIIRKYRVDIPVEWISRMLHMDTKKLHIQIQKCIDNYQDMDEIVQDIRNQGIII